jgi:hypothetical protein
MTASATSSSGSEPRGEAARAAGQRGDDGGTKRRGRDEASAAM